MLVMSYDYHLQIGSLSLLSAMLHDKCIPALQHQTLLNALCLSSILDRRTTIAALYELMISSVNGSTMISSMLEKNSNTDKFVD